MSPGELLIFGAVLLILSVAYTALTGWVTPSIFAVVIILALGFGAAVEGW